MDFEISHGHVKTQRSEVVDGHQLIVSTVVTDLVDPLEPTQTTVTTLDPWRMPLQVVDPVGNVRHYQYNDYESPYLVTLELDENFQTTKYSYDPFGHPAQVGP